MRHQPDRPLHKAHIAELCNVLSQDGRIAVTLDPQPGNYRSSVSACGIEIVKS